MIIFLSFAFSIVRPMWLPERRQVYLSASQDDLICGSISSPLKKYDSDLFSPVTSVLVAIIFPNNSTLTFESKNDKEKVCTVNCPTQATYFAHFDFCICIS